MGGAGGGIRMAEDYTKRLDKRGRTGVPRTRSQHLYVPFEKRGSLLGLGKAGREYHRGRATRGRRCPHVRRANNLGTSGDLLTVSGSSRKLPTSLVLGGRQQLCGQGWWWDTSVSAWREMELRAIVTTTTTITLMYDLLGVGGRGVGKQGRVLQERSPKIYG